VPNLLEIENFSQVELGDEVVFEDFDFDGNLVSATGLRNFYKINWQ